ncbi:collagen alpha-2(I) chain-like [Cinclus cinclus]|uniref:collagen alpha-2(I) chain-like n=1 Tax=Cinclus cinclus TaxID=127875 RepID=UPI002E146746
MDGRAAAAAGGARRPSRGAAGAAAAAAATPSGSREYRDGGTGRRPWGRGGAGDDRGVWGAPGRGEGGGEGTEPKGPYGRARGLGPASPPLRAAGLAHCPSSPHRCFFPPFSLALLQAHWKARKCRPREPPVLGEKGHLWSTTDLVPNGSIGMLAGMQDGDIGAARATLGTLGCAEPPRRTDIPQFQSHQSMVWPSAPQAGAVDLML